LAMVRRWHVGKNKQLHCAFRAKNSVTFRELRPKGKIDFIGIKL